MGYDTTERLKKFEEKLTAAAMSKVSYMSNTKWEKLFQAIEASDIAWQDICGASIRFLLEGEERWFNFTDYWGGYLEGTYGAARYKEIEWIFIPSTYEIQRRNRDERLQPKRVNNEVDGLKALY